MGADKKRSLVLTTLLLTCFTFSLFSQEGRFDSTLAQKIDSVFKKDQLFRKVLSPIHSRQIKDSLEKEYHQNGKRLDDTLIKVQRKIDSSNYKFIDSLFISRGYPGKSVVGQQRMDYAAIILLHSINIKKHIDLLRTAAKNKELNAAVFALIADRNLVNLNKKQYYGTQVVSFSVPVKKSYLWPISKPGKINKRRTEVGLGKIEAYSKIFGIEYSPNFKSRRYLNRLGKKENIKK